MRLKDGIALISISRQGIGQTMAVAFALRHRPDACRPLLT